MPKPRADRIDLMACGILVAGKAESHVYSDPEVGVSVDVYILSLSKPMNVCQVVSEACLELIIHETRYRTRSIVSEGLIGVIGRDWMSRVKTV